MSEFDREAEREKLREQLEAEKEDREASQRMSELLLGGATMTGKHCGNCASPIFRQNGREFCPNCNQAVGETARDHAAGEAQEQADHQPPGEAPGQPTPDQPTAEESQDGRTVDAAGASQPQVEPADSIPEGQQDATSEPGPSADASHESRPTTDASEVAVAGGDGDLAAAHDALARKLTRLAAQAEATDDVGRARELLAATREAAEALAALERVGDGS